MQQRWIVAIAAAAALWGANPDRAEAQRATPNRINGKPNLNVIWQAMNTANWNLEAQAATALPDFWRLGAIGAVPAGLSVVKEGKIPYLPAALAKRDWDGAAERFTAAKQALDGLVKDWTRDFKDAGKSF